MAQLMPLIVALQARVLILPLTLILFFASPQFASPEDNSNGSNKRAILDCRYQMSKYMARLETLLARTFDSVTPFNLLNRQTTPFRSCKLEDVQKSVLHSSFFKAEERKQSGRHLFIFANDEIEVGFTFVTKDSATELHYARFIKSHI